MKERLREFGANRWILGASLGVLVLAGCGNDGSSEPTEPDSAVVKSETTASEIEVTYFENGSREIIIPGGIGSSTDVHVLQFCLGLDLFTNSQQSYDADSYGQGAAGGTTVNEDYRPCLDGRLTPSDFKIQE